MKFLEIESEVRFFKFDCDQFKITDSAHFFSSRLGAIKLFYSNLSQSTIS
jgi:hypothetical protein